MFVGRRLLSDRTNSIHGRAIAIMETMLEVGLLGESTGSACGVAYIGNFPNWRTSSISAIFHRVTTCNLLELRPIFVHGIQFLCSSMANQKIAEVETLIDASELFSQEKGCRLGRTMTFMFVAFGFPARRSLAQQTTSPTCY
jgi:hypothetical protein